MAWKKGISGNPKGRPKRGKTLTDILRKHLKKKTIEDLDTGNIITVQEALVKELIRVAIEDKNFMAQKYIFDRMDGFPVQAIVEEITTKKEKHNFDNLTTEELEQLEKLAGKLDNTKVEENEDDHPSDS